MNQEWNENSLDTLCAGLCCAMGIEAPKYAAAANAALTEYVDSAFAGAKADRVFMYNPDAIAQWVWEKYPYLLREVAERTELQLPLRSDKRAKDRWRRWHRAFCRQETPPSFGLGRVPARSRVDRYAPKRHGANSPRIARGESDKGWCS